MITLYWSPQSRAGHMLWALEEIAQPYQLRHIDIHDAKREDPAEFMEASPLRKIPAIVDGDVKMADSAAIALYLADRYAPGVLAPTATDKTRGEFLYWLFYTPSVVEPAMTEKFVDLPLNPIAYPWGSFEKMLTALETRLDGRDWVATDRFSMADFMISGSIQAMCRFEFLDPSATLQSYMDRCLNRPAARHALEKEKTATEALQA